ncbi:hypothetical protein L3Q72_21970 [Vibrio sp. JC009]|uniref:hypothetical protein n=1 Tax=Vibrio sp. JC009 TaxID=2912314 RepID=UPI0023B0A274|nr:hypothetical protein [Vibrio sp. JC009]WED23903.1 hypothetical protein L3Q72_21970 [Vibrio sp. JC009]
MEKLNNTTSVGLMPEQENSSCLENYYRSQICTLEKRLLREPKCVDSLKTWIGSYQALADIYNKKGELQQAQRCLFIPHHSMLYMAHHNNGDEELELIAKHAISLTLPPLLAFSEIYPPCDNCMRELRAQQKSLESDINTYH